MSHILHMMKLGTIIPCLRSQDIAWFLLQCRVQQFFGGCSSSAARQKTVVELRSLWGHVNPSPVGSRGEAPKNFGWIALVALNGRLSIFSWINFYKFESLGVWVWDPKLVYWVQNTSRYGTVLMSTFFTGN